MANLTHVLEWDSIAGRFVCRTGACRFAKIKSQLEAAGYKPSETGTVFVKESDFEQTMDCIGAIARID